MMKPPVRFFALFLLPVLLAASAQAAIDNNANSFKSGSLSTSDIQNQAGYSGSSSGISLGTDMLTSKYGAARGIVTNLMDNASESGSASSVTQAAISGIAGNTEARTGDTPTGIAPIFSQTQVQNNLAASLTVKNVLTEQTLVAVADPVAAADNGQKKIVLEKSCDPSQAGCSANGVQTIQVDPGSLDASNVVQLAGPDGVIYVFNNGINNTEQQALNNAATQLGDTALDQGVSAIINPYTGNIVSEVLYAGLDKLREVTGLTDLFGISNASEANIDLRNAVAQYNLTAPLDQQIQIVEVDYSRGSMTSSVATQNQVQSGDTTVPLATVTFNGGAANAQRMVDTVQQATSGNGMPGLVYEATQVNDAIGTIIGGNAATGGNSDVGILNAHTTYGPNTDTNKANNV
jgi:filamentous hemagglutinin